MSKAKKRAGQVTVILTGDKELNEKLRKLAGPVAKKFIRRASREALRPVASAAQRNAPNDTGALRKSIRVKAIVRSRSRIGSRVTTNASDNAFKGDQFYGGFLEFGWKTGKRKSKKRRPVMGELYMTRAARSKKRSALTIYRHGIAAGIRSVIT